MLAKNAWQQRIFVVTVAFPMNSAMQSGTRMVHKGKFRPTNPKPTAPISNLTTEKGIQKSINLETLNKPQVAFAITFCVKSGVLNVFVMVKTAETPTNHPLKNNPTKQKTITKKSIQIILKKSRP